MASHKTILRPIEDISVEHSRVPVESESLYSLINEEICDGETSYIYASSSAEDTESFKSKFLLPSVDCAKIKVKSITCVWIGKSAGFTSLAGDPCVLYFGDNDEKTTYRATTDLYQTELEWGEMYIANFPPTGYAEYRELNAYISKYKKIPSIELEIENSVKGTESISGEMKSQSLVISQIYLEIEYEEVLNIGIHRKVGGAVKAATAAYRKLGGTWQEIDEAEAKDILKNNIITQGGS